MGLGPPNPWLIASATETLDFRGSNFSLGLWLLMPTFALRNAPAALAGPPSLLIQMLSYRWMQMRERKVAGEGCLLFGF